MKEPLRTGPLRLLVEAEANPRTAEALMVPRDNRTILVFGSGLPSCVRRMEYPECLEHARFTEARIYVEFRDWPSAVGCRR